MPLIAKYRLTWRGSVVEQYRPAVGAFKDSGAILSGTGKGTLHMAEQFAFRERLHQSGTIAGNERA